MSDSFKVTQLANGLWDIDEGLVRCFLIAGNERAVLLDCCATADDSLPGIVDDLTDKPLRLVFTHTDRDHTGGQDGFDTPLLHPSEYAYYYLKGNEGREVTPLWEGEQLDLGGITLEVVLIPGHTPGSLALLDRENRRLFTGDTISDYWIHMFGMSRNLPAFLESLKKLESMIDCFDSVCCCHGSAVLESEWVIKTRTAAEKLLAGELEGIDPPADMPCKVYRYDGVALLY